MNSHARRWVALLLVGAASPVLAQTTPQAAATFYVSERFKALAKRVVREILTQEVARACPPDQPLCPMIAQRLGEAVGAAIENDDSAVRAALNGLFVDASAEALLQVTAGGVWGGSGPHVDPASVQPLVRCVAASLANKPLRSACSASNEAARLLEELFRRYPCVGNDEPFCAALVTSVKDRMPIQADVALRALAALAVSDAVRRPDLRVFLLGLVGIVQSGLDAGLSPALLRYLSGKLSSESVELFVAQGLVDYRPDAPASKQLWDEDGIAAWGEALKRCGQDPAPLEAWRTGRAGLLSTWRRQVLLAEDVDFHPLTALLDYKTSCPAEADARKIAQLQSFIRYFTAQAQVYVWLVRYGAAGLAAAAAVDYVRTGDQARLARDLQRTFVYAVATAGRQRLVGLALDAEAVSTTTAGTRLTGDGLLWVGDALASCEAVALATTFGVSMPQPKAHVPVPDGQCRSLVDGRVRPRVVLPQRPPTTTVEEWVRAQAPALLAQLAPLFEYTAATIGGRVGELDPSVLERARAALAEGDAATARLVLIRAGVDLLAAHLERVSAEMVGVSDERCREDLRARSILTDIGRGCVVHVLLTGAYRPIAEYYWAGGRAPDELATAGYRGLLANPALQYTPIILNVGLGGTYVQGRSQRWGTEGYGALTVLDKIGLAFYKRLDERNPFELGVFAGGFLDALVRTAADSGKEQRYWLLGLTGGFPRLGGVSLGLEAHVGAAMPFRLNDRTGYGFAAGAAIVVPFDTYFAE